MKLCQKCGRVYYDERLNFCLDDGEWLADDDTAADTAILGSSESPTRARDLASDRPRPISSSLWMRDRMVAAVGILLISVVVLAGYWLYRTRPGKHVDSIAVMPFENQSGDADLDYLSDGMTETLIGSLSHLPDLKVKARTSVFRYKGTPISPRAVGNDLSVQAVLLGHVLRMGDQLVLRLELVDAATENVIWSEQYNRKPTDLLLLQTEIARDVSQKLKLKLSGVDEQNLAKKYTENIEAYKLYLQGRFHWNKRTGDEVNKSIEYFQKAIDADPSYALAYAGLADAYSIVPSFSNASPNEFFPKAKAAAQKALALDESLAEAHTALARILFAYEWKFAESDREYQRAIELNPNYATAHHWFGNANLLRTARFDDSIAEMKQAQELDPLSLVINADLGENLIYAGRYDEAIAQLRKTIELDDKFHYAHWLLGLAYEEKGQYSDSISEYKRSLELSVNNPWTLALLAHVYARSGDRANALQTLAALKDVAGQVYVPPYNFAVVYSELGETDLAFEALDQSYRDRGQELTRLKVDILLTALHDDPRYGVLMKNVGF